MADRIGVERAMDKQFVAYVELGDDPCAHCFADCIQLITGSTFFKGSIKVCIPCQQQLLGK